MLQGYRTYIVSAIVAVLGVLAAVDWNSVLQNPKNTGGMVAIALSVIMAILRSITTTPPGSSAPTVPPDVIPPVK
jgi:hypothetical protein